MMSYGANAPCSTGSKTLTGPASPAPIRVQGTPTTEGKKGRPPSSQRSALLTQPGSPLSTARCTARARPAAPTTTSANERLRCALGWVVENHFLNFEIFELGKALTIVVHSADLPLILTGARGRGGRGSVLRPIITINYPQNGPVEP